MASDCIFCLIVSGEIPAQLVREGEGVIAFQDLEPKAPTHVLVIPREHYKDVGELAAADPGVLAELVTTAAQIAGEQSGGEYRLVFNSGAEAGQSVFHVHGHVLGGRKLTWPPG